MIRLSLTFKKIEKLLEPTVVIVVDEAENNCHQESQLLVKNSKKECESYTWNGHTVHFDQHEELELGEVCLLFPEANVLQRFFRPQANQNTIMITEQCDQMCMMCSQPPKNKDYLFWDLYLEALKLIPRNSIIGITGGEPTIFKIELFEFIEKAVLRDKTLQFHVLTNGQHFDENDKSFLNRLSSNILWGVPLYSHNQELHDYIVGKRGAFKKLEKTFGFLISTGSRLELRTVILKDNYLQLHNMAKFVSKHFDWIEIWAVMQLEQIGFAKIDWLTKFVDTSEHQDLLKDVHINTSTKGINVRYYNFPLCTLPVELRDFATKSISDWKNKYLEECKMCTRVQGCSGFFEWYNENEGFNHIGAIK